MNIKRKTLIKVVICTIIALNLVSCNIAAGSYPYAELYEFKVSEPLIIQAVNEFKSENPDYCLPNQERFNDGRRNANDHWYHVWFYYPKDNQIVKCWIRGSQLGFIGLGGYPSLTNYKEINNGFSRQENRLQKEKFERLILKNIQKKIE